MVYIGLSVAIVSVTSCAAANPANSNRNIINRKTVICLKHLFKTVISPNVNYFGVSRIRNLLFNNSDNFLESYSVPNVFYNTSLEANTVHLSTRR